MRAGLCCCWKRGRPGRGKGTLHGHEVGNQEQLVRPPLQLWTPRWEPQSSLEAS